MSLRLIGAASFLLVLPIVAFAAEFRTGDQPSLASGQTVQDDLYMAGGNVTSAGSVRGDLVIAAGSVLVSGPVSGDLMVGGGNVTILGEVTDDVRIGAGNVTVQGVVRGDVLAGGGQVNLTGTRIDGDVAVGGGSIRIDAAVGGDLKIGGGEVYLNAPVAGNVEIEAEELTLGPRAAIAGDLWYRATSAATMEEGATVRGETLFEERAGRDEAKALFAGIITAWVIAKFFMILTGALLLAYIFRRYSRELVATAATQPLAELVRGIVVAIVFPILSIILLMTVIGIPLGAIGLLAFAMLIIFVSLASPIVLGSIVHKMIWKPAGYEVNWKTVLLGVALYMLACLIPFIGYLAITILKAITLGAALNIKWSVAKDWR